MLDRAAVVTANAETVVVKPSGIQEAINAEIGKLEEPLSLSKSVFPCPVFMY